MRIAITIIAISLASPAFADPPDILAASYSGGRLSVTLAHADTGWDDYADAWEVLDADGNSLGIRELAHPHVEEQPFTRSLSVDLGTPAPNSVFLRARANTTGWGDVVEITLD